MESGLVDAESSSCSPRKKFANMSNILKYLLSNTCKANWTAARDTCCSIGLTLAAIPTMGKKTCMDKMISSNYLTKTLNFDKKR